MAGASPPPRCGGSGLGGAVCVTSGPAGRLPAPARRPVPPAHPRVPGTARTTGGPPAAMPRRRPGLSRFREPGADLSGPFSVFVRNGSHRTGRVGVRDHPQPAADGCGRPGYPVPSRQPRRLPGADPARVRLTAPHACRAGGRTSAGAGRTGLAGGPCGKNRSGSARGVPSGCAMVRVARFIASAGVNGPLVTDTDAPRPVAGAVEENRTVRLRPASGSRKRLSPARRRAIAAGGPPVVRAAPGKATVTSPVSPCRCPSWRTGTP
jgi:hypothetical protein